ncbi:MAG: AzlC family ABC transporter permease [Burkholderiales bacterium]|nr:AzlC family ABC transporter permease [Burkholderiales bacterium]
MALHRRAFGIGAREALGVPAAVLGAGFLGYGSLAADAGYSIWMTLAATFAIWALPGQLVLMEMHAGGAAVAATVLAVSLSAARFFPMTLTLMPLMREGRRGRSLWQFLLAAQLVSMTTWAVAMRRFNEADLEDLEARWHYFLGFSAVCIGSAALFAIIGQLLLVTLPPLLRYGLALLTPLYFFVTLVGEAQSRSAFTALVCGAATALALYSVAPGWSLLGAGFIGGTAAFLLQGNHARRD